MSCVARHDASDGDSVDRVWVHDHSSINHFHRKWAGLLTVRTDSWFQVYVVFEEIFFRQVAETSRDTKNMMPFCERF